MTKKQQTILLAVIGVVLVLAIVIVAVGAWVFTSLVENEPLDEAGATKTFDEIRTHFNGATPIVDLRPEGPVLMRKPPDAKPAGELKTLHILRWNVQEERLTRVDLPFAILRMRNGPIRLQVEPDDSGFKVSTTLRVSDIERFGPALLLDDNLPDGARVLVWSD